MDNLKSRNYQDGDEHAILDLFKRCFSRSLGMDFWKWRFVENPAGKGIMRLMFDGDKLVGHYAAIPMDFIVGGKKVTGALSMTSMTDPEYAGRGIFTRLASEAYDECKKRGITFVYGFPNANSMPGFEKKLGWKNFGEIDVLSRKSAINEKLSGNVMEIKSFGKEFDSLWDSVSRDFYVGVQRNSRFLNWRFCMNPDVKYIKLAFMQAGELKGYIVAKIFDSKKAHIVDYLASDKEVFNELLASAFSKIQEKGTEDISCWSFDKTLYLSSLIEKGFVRTKSSQYFGSPTYFGCRSLDGTFIKDLSDIDNWHLSMGDSDVF